VSVIPANRSTAWLTANAATGAGSYQVMMLASSGGLTPGVYNTTLLIQATNAVPQFVEVPVGCFLGSAKCQCSAAEIMPVLWGRQSCLAAAFQAAFSGPASVFDHRRAPAESRRRGGRFSPATVRIQRAMASRRPKACGSSMS
jgi:hypothetical protein